MIAKAINFTKAKRVSCSEQVPFSYGSLAGILCAIFTLSMEATFIVFATKLVKKKKVDEDVEMRESL